MTDTIADAAPPPGRHRGRRAFIAALGIGQIVSWGSLYYSFPLLAGPMTQEFGLTKPEVYGAATVGLAAASLAAYPVGAAIDRGHGRMVMTLGSALAAFLLLAWSLLSAGWALYPVFAGIGLAQAMTLYEPAFAVVARRYGPEARSGITALTLWGGFASTVFVPFIQLLLDGVGWRQTLLALAAVNVMLGVAPHLAAINPAADTPTLATAPMAGRRVIGWAMRKPAFWGILVAFTVYYGTFSALTFHLYPLLLERGYDTATVVGAIALIGPSQVAGRIVVWIFAVRRSIRAVGGGAVLGFPAALLLLWLLPSGFASLAVFAAVYGAANGVMTIVRGLAVPEMLTRDAYGALNGVLAVPSTAAKAVAPAAAAILWSATGAYDAVLLVAFGGSLMVVAGFWLAAMKSGAAPEGDRSA
ncbi:putative MFS family arabinose efflux permease [Azospirillum agricola]|uniref:MFS transporter n=1 Tax=Azospirillum agricola TaxID=1720247 RepID=UPI001AE3B261|nr:MFS transporter [Azospirillum agricola]MBP2226759.1 putative MFS family arabinose efflux permease [Azospirillum agricola]